MAFVISKKQTYAWPVKIKMPQGGQWENHGFTATFQRIPAAKIQEWMKNLADEDQKPEERYDYENTVISEVLVGWEGVQDAEGTPVPFSDETRRMLVEIVEVRKAIFEAFFDSGLGKKAEAKNSKTQRGGG